MTKDEKKEILRFTVESRRKEFQYRTGSNTADAMKWAI